MTREEAKEFFEDPNVNYQTHGYYTEEEEIEANNWAISALSADVRPNIHGHWKRRTYIGNHETVTMNVCSECGKEFGWDVETGIAISDNNFCPNCGADMREPKGEKGEI